MRNLGRPQMPPSETRFFEINEPSWSRRADDEKVDRKRLLARLRKLILSELAVFLPLAAPFMPSLQ